MAANEPWTERIPSRVLRRRAWRLRCPICGVGRPFDGLFRMRHACGSCGFRYCREPGYFLGSIYLNYGVTGTLAVGWAILAAFHLELGLFGRIVAPALVMAVLPFLLLRHARSLWMAFDLTWDPPVEKDFEER